MTGARVFIRNDDDARVPPLVRVLHAEFCRGRPHTGLKTYTYGRSSEPLCVRIYLVVTNYQR